MLKSIPKLAVITCMSLYGANALADECINGGYYGSVTLTPQYVGSDCIINGHTIAGNTTTIACDASDCMKASNWTIADGSGGLKVLLGTSSLNTQIGNLGTENVSGGISTNVNINGTGSQIISYGGVSKNATISKGTQIVGFGSTIDTTSLSDNATLVIQNGAILHGKINVDNANLSIAQNTSISIDTLQGSGKINLYLDSNLIVAKASGSFELNILNGVYEHLPNKIYLITTTSDNTATFYLKDGSFSIAGFKYQLSRDGTGWYLSLVN